MGFHRETIFVIYESQFLAGTQLDPTVSEASLRSVGVPKKQRQLALVFRIQGSEFVSAHLGYTELVGLLYFT
jgi:hypothetical protein